MVWQSVAVYKVTFWHHVCVEKLVQGEVPVKVVTLYPAEHYYHRQVIYELVWCEITTHPPHPQLFGPIVDSSLN